MSRRSSRTLDRREFLGRSAAAAAALTLGAYANPSAARASRLANERVRIAAVGATGRAAGNLSDLSSQDIIAIADVDSDLLDKGTAPFPAARKYRDFRVMLEKEAENIDAVMVSCPDHTHAPAAAMGMRLGKHCYCEKPLTHTVREARTLAELAAEKKLATQMGTQIHAGDNYRRVVELIRAGAIGSVREAHVVVNVNYSGAKFVEGQECPPNLDWNLWLGPAAERPYSPGPHPFNWRRFWDYGTGGLGDFGCHYMDLVHWALDLRGPTKVAARGPELDPVSCPPWVIVDYEYPARGELPPVKLSWYDGGQKPEIWDQLKKADGSPLGWGSGQLFIGEKGMLISDYGSHVLLPQEKFADYQRPEPTIPNSIGHHAEWIEAVKTGSPTTCNFDYSGALTEAVLLGVVSYRSGKALEWDAAAFKITNAPEVEPWLHKEYRKGWTL